jgi:hypothetical protein
MNPVSTFLPSGKQYDLKTTFRGRQAAATGL